MPQILKLLIKYKTPAIISTKSKLVLKEFRKTNASTGLHVISIIPYLTDMEQNFDPESTSLILLKGVSRYI